MTLSPKKRIFLNIVVTYGRTLLGTICGIFTARWALMALGEVDFGLFGVVGGLAAFIDYAAQVVSGSVSRFYAFSIGKMEISADCRSEECLEWFNTALFLHIVIPCLSLLCIYPPCEYAIRNWLTIPPERMDACIWVFRFITFSVIITAICVPFRAMFIARQYIAEVALYDMLQVGGKVLVLYYMASHPGAWLVKYALFFSLLTAVPHLLLAIRGSIMFPECRIIKRYLWNVAKLRELFSFSCWNTCSTFAHLVRNQGNSIVINKYFGPAVNGAGAIAAQLAGQAATLAGAAIYCFAPEITRLCGAGKKTEMVNLTILTTKVGTMLTLLFAIPLSLELHTILKIWLKTPPAYTEVLCQYGIAAVVLQQMTVGQILAVNAIGRIALFQSLRSLCLMSSLPLAWGFSAAGYSPAVVGIATVVSLAVCCLFQAVYAQKVAYIPVKSWFMNVIVPAGGIGVVCYLAGITLQVMVPPSLFRLSLTCAGSACLYFVLLWFWGLTKRERALLREGIGRVLGSFKVISPAENN